MTRFTSVEDRIDRAAHGVLDRMPAHGLSGALIEFLVFGLKQGWAFAWRSLLAGELIVSIANRQSLGFLLQLNRELADAVGLYGVMIVILVVGVVIDALVFATVEKALRRRRGLLVS